MEVIFCNFDSCQLCHELCDITSSQWKERDISLAPKLRGPELGNLAPMMSAFASLSTSGLCTSLLPLRVLVASYPPPHPVAGKMDGRPHLITCLPKSGGYHPSPSHSKMLEKDSD